tara:strand:+ start:533 stop:1270 length:738 start_codon:yes stop_codon:yes gene_type:complete
MSELSEKVAIVTGGSRGIGLAVSQELARAGCTLAIIGRNKKRVDSAVASLSNNGHQAYTCDVSDSVDTLNIVKLINNEFGSVDILVNNAGITKDNLFIRMTEEDWDDVINVNLKGAFNMTKALARNMMKRRAGVIINITSVVGLTGNPGQANYAASKAGLIGFTKSIAQELAPRGVRCNAIAPGFIDTDMTAELDDETVKELHSRIPMGHLGRPSDVADLVRFLAGPAAHYITGQIISVDGGMVM